MTALVELGPWGWVIAGIVLMGLELLAPGAFMLWLGLAAVLTGMILFVMPLPWEATLLVFAGLTVLAVLIGRKLSRRRTGIGEAALNDRAARIVGRTFVLESAIAEGRGRVRVDDTVWRVEGPDLPVGAHVRVVGMAGTLLKVEAA